MDEKTEMLHKLCKALMDELDDYSKKIEKSDGMSAGDLEAVDKLSHALKSVKTTIAMMEADGGEEGYSNRYMPYWGGMSYASDMRGGNMGNISNRGGNSYARGRGSNARRDSMGRYSREGGYSYAEDVEATLDEIREMTQKLPEEHRTRIERAIDMR